MTAQLRFQNLTLGYDRHPAVHHLDGAIEVGSLTAVVGPNGAGKSTLFKGVVGVIKPLAGKIERHGVLPQDIAYLPQIAEIDRSFPISVYDMVAMGLWRSKGLFGGIGRKERDTVEAAIAAVGLTGFEPRAIGTLSGGQMQRMLFARLLLQDAGVIALAMYDYLVAPFAEFEFMRRALAGTLALALGAGPIGVFLMLRRMSLVGDAMAHAILPGAAIGFLLSGLNLFAMATGGLIAGFAVAILAGVVARTTELKEDASLATFYLVSLALGVTIVSIKGTNIDLLHVLFGNILAMDDQTLLVIAFNATITLIVLAVIFRPLVIECVDPVFLRTVSRAGAPAHLAFLALVVINLVNGFHALGTLLAVGLMILPAGIARFWSRDITGMICIAVASAMVSGYAGLVLSFQTRIPSGPAIILVAAAIYVFSVLFGNVSGLVRQLFPGRHLEA